MIGLISNLRLILLGGALAIAAGLGAVALYYKKEAEHYKERLSVEIEKNKELTLKLRSLAQECDRTVKSLQEGCSERLRIERQEHERQLTACKKLLERRSKIEKKLNEIDSLR